MKNWSPGYALLKLLVVLWHFLFYKKIVVVGRENIPQSEPIVFAPNHQNALMDALAIVSTCWMQPVFLARADIFKNPIIARILKFLRIMPVYRIRDGKDELAKNDEIFNKSMSVLENNGAIAIFPEANHAGFRHLRPLKKGIPRIVFQAEERNAYKLGVKIVPVGIYYSNYPNMKSILLVKYGDPFEIAPFNPIFKENQQKGMIALRNEIAKNIRPNIIDIPDMAHNDFYENARDVFDSSVLKHMELKSTPENKFKADQFIISKLHNIQLNSPEQFNKVNERLTAYSEIIETLELPDSLIESRPASPFRFILTFSLFLISLPIHLGGLILNYLPYSLIKRHVDSKIKDVQFRSSFTFVLGLIIYPAWFFIITGIASIWFDSSLIFWAVLILIPTLGLFTLNNWIRYKQTLLKLKLARLSKSENQELIKALELRKDLIGEVDEILAIK